MITLPPIAAEVKPATPAPFALALPTELDFLEAVARDMFDDMTDEELEAMAGQSAAMDALEAGLIAW